MFCSDVKEKNVPFCHERMRANFGSLCRINCRGDGHTCNIREQCGFYTNEINVISISNGVVE